MGEAKKGALRVDFDRTLKLEFHVWRCVQIRTNSTSRHAGWVLPAHKWPLGQDMVAEFS